MKTLYKYIYILLCMPLFWISCSDDDDKNVEPDVPTESKLEIIKNVEVFTAEGGTQDVEFSASQKWTVESEQSWCSVSPTTGMSGKRSVTINVKANETTDERNSKVTFKSGTAEKIITVVQKQKDALLLSSAKADVPAEGKNLSVELKANVNFEYVIDEAAKEWIVPIESRGMKTSTVSFKIKKNEVVEKREGKIYFVAGNLKETFTVYQKGDEARLILNKKEYIIDYNAQDVTIDVESNISDYEIKMPNETWLSMNTSRSMSSYSHIIAVKENTTGGDRSAIIKFICGERTDSVKIIQKQKDVIALLSNDSCLNVKAEGGPLCFDVTSNVDFNVKISDSWIYQSQKSRKLLQNRLSFQVENNPSLEERRATITLEGGEAKQVITVIQEGQSEEGGIEVLNTLSTFGQPAEEQILKIKALGKWHVDVDQPWCRVTPSEGVPGEYELKVSVGENTSFDERNSVMYLRSGSIEVPVTVVQKQKDALFLTSKTQSVASDGGVISVNTKSNISYNYKIEGETSSWITPAETRGLQEATHHFNVAENTTDKSREGYIVFTADNGISETFTVYQAAGEGPQLVLTQKYFVVGSVSQDILIEVQHNTKYHMEMPAVDWLHEKQTKSMSTYTHRITVDENTTTDVRSAQIKFVCGDIIEYVEICQQAKDALILSKDSVYVEALGGNLNFDVQTNVELKVKTSVDWIKYTPKSKALKTETLNFVVQENVVAKERSGEIEITAGTSKQVVIVVQKAFVVTEGLEILNTLNAFVTAGGTQTLKIKSSGDWTIASEQVWCKVSPTTGGAGENEINVTVDANTSYDERNAALILKTGAVEKRVTVVQKQQNALILSSKEKEELTAAGGEIRVDLKSNVPYTCTISPDAVEWITVLESRGLTSSSRSFQIKPNPNLTKRQGTITFMGGGQSQLVTIYQDGEVPQLILTQNVYNLEAASKEIKIELKSNTDFEIVIPDASWLREKVTRTMSSYTRYITVDENTTTKDRSAEILFKYAGKTEKVTVNQKGQTTSSLEVLNTLKTFVSAGEKQILQIKSNNDWTIKSEQGWCKVSPSSGKAGTHDIEVISDANTSYDERNSALIITSGSIEKRLTVTQKQKDALILTSSKSEVASSGGEISIDLKSNVTYECTISADAASWITALDTRGLTASSRRFQIKPNPNLTNRQGTIEFTGSGLKEVFMVHQAGETPQLVLSKRVYDLESSKSEIQIELQTNSKYAMVMPGVSWLRENTSRTMSSYTRYITVDENTTTDDRSAEIKFTYAGKTEIVTINQKAKSALVLKKTNYDIEAVGGNLDINFESNTDYEITTSVEWIKKATKSRALTAKTVSFIVDENNASIERIGEIIFKKGLDEQKVIVTQKGKKITGRFVMKHSRVQCNVPRFTDSATVTGTINWGDSSTSEYVEGITHTYITPGTYEVVIQLDKVRKVELKDIDGIELIDLSSF